VAIGVPKRQFSSYEAQATITDLFFGCLLKLTLNLWSPSVQNSRAGSHDAF